MARSRARVRVFSDDGHCVARRAGHAPGAGVRQAPSAASSASTRRTRASPVPTACCHEGELSGPARPARLARRSPRSRSWPATSCSRGTPAAGCTSPTSRTAGSVEVIRWAKAQGIDVTAEVTPHHLLLTTDLLVGYDPVYKVNPPLRPERGRRGAARGPRRRHHRRRRHRPRAARPARQGARLRRRGVRDARPRDGVRGGAATCMVADGRLGWADVARRDVDQPGPDRRAGRTTASPLAAGQPGQPHPRRPHRDWSPSTATPRSRCPATTPWHGHTPRPAAVATPRSVRGSAVTARPSRARSPVTAC